MTTVEQFNEYLPEFIKWLKEVKKYSKQTVASRVSNMKTIAEYYDIFQEFAGDECEGILDELAFSKSSMEPKTSISISGDYYSGLATYRSALKLYVAFLQHIHYVAPAAVCAPTARFIGSFDEFKRYINPHCRNEVNRFCKKERIKQNKICEYCGNTAELQSAHVKERPIIIKDILTRFYKVGTDLYDVKLDEFFKKFEDAHMPIHEHIFFLCGKCHTDLDKRKTITVEDIKKKRDSKSNWPSATLRFRMNLGD